MIESPIRRRGFFGTMFAAATGIKPAIAKPNTQKQPTDLFDIPAYAKAQLHQVISRSPLDPDTSPLLPQTSRQLFDESGPGLITNIKLAVTSNDPSHLKGLTLRIYWDNNPLPSVEAPIADFFGLNLGQYAAFDSHYLSCFPNGTLSCSFVMPFRRHSLITIANQGDSEVSALSYEIECQKGGALPEDAYYFCAQYQQSSPLARKRLRHQTDHLRYAIIDAFGPGHMVGFTLGVVKGTEGVWAGLGEEALIDGDADRTLARAGVENFLFAQTHCTGPNGTLPFAQDCHGSPVVMSPTSARGRYSYYQWRPENPLPFRKRLCYSLKWDSTKGSNDCLSSVGYWYKRV